jgi:OmpA-OmpF porin, OOP family
MPRSSTSLYRSSYRPLRWEGRLLGWIVLAALASMGLHWFIFRATKQFSLLRWLGMKEPVAPREQLTVDLRRARIEQQAPEERTAPQVENKALDRPIPPPVVEPLDLSKMNLKAEEILLTPRVEMPANLTQSRPLAAGALGAPSQLLAELPSSVDRGNLAEQLSQMPDRIGRDPRLASDQVVIPIKDESLPDDTALKDVVNAATQIGTGGRGGTEDGFAALDDLLNYQGPVTEDLKTMMPTDLLFDYNETVLKDTARTSLMKLAFIIQKNKTADISIEGHSDLFGSDDYNRRLSQGRAEAVKQWLVDTLQLDPAQMETLGWGKEKPLIPGGTIDQQAKNRRVEIVIRPRGGQ